MTKIIGCMTAWGAEDFILPALQQAEQYCDEVFVCVAPHSEVMKQFRDSTESIARRFIRRSEKTKLINWTNVNFHAPTKANILNTMLSKSAYRKPGNWIWVLDVDEFYPEKTYCHVRSFVDASNTNHNFDRVEFQEYYFYINMWHYLEGSHLRLFKIKSEQNIFQPTQRWVYAENPIVFDFEYCPMFHYGMLTNPFAKEAFWGSEYPDKAQNNKVKWLMEIYRNYDLNDEDKWVEENRKRFGITSPWFSDSFRPNMEGKLHRFSGYHPGFIPKELRTEQDFRHKYKFLPTE